MTRSLFVKTVIACIPLGLAMYASGPAHGMEVLPGLLGNDLTDLGDDGNELLYAPPNLGGFDAEFFSSDEEGFGGGEFAFNVFDNIVGPTNDKWCCGTVFPQIVGADFGDDTFYALTHFTVSSANDTPGRDPLIWQIQGSVNGKCWETIFSQDDVATVWTARNQTIQWSADAGDFEEQDVGYSKFRMITFQTGLVGGAFFQIGEIEFFGEEAPSAEPIDVCDECYDAVANVHCEVNGDTVDITWENTCGCIAETSILAGGEELETVAPDAISFSIALADLPANIIGVRNCSGISASCNIGKVGPNNLILDKLWSAIGPFQNADFCTDDPQDLLNANYFSNDCWNCVFPIPGDELENYDANFNLNTPYVGLNPLENPRWFVFSDGNENEQLDFDAYATANGVPFDFVAMFANTYIELTDDMAIQFCVDSDDAIAVIFDDQIIYSFNTCRGADLLCQDITPIVDASAGLHRIGIGVWENSGGWNGILKVQDEFGVDVGEGPGSPIIYHGHTPPPAMLASLIDEVSCVCPAPPPSITLCQKNPDGSVSLEWLNPEGIPAGTTSILVDGVEVAQLPTSATSFTIPAADAANGGFATVLTPGSNGDTCGYGVTDLQGRITEWLVLGPFLNGIGCSLIPEDYQTNFMPNACIQTQYPVEGDTVDDFDPVAAAANGSTYIGMTDEGFPDPDGTPQWIVFDDGFEDGSLNMQAWAVSNAFSTVGDGADDMLAWTVTYFEYTGDPTTIAFCFSSDDGGAIFLDDTQALIAAACRGWGTGTCLDVSLPIDLEPGLHRIAAMSSERAGGWGHRVAMQDELGVPITDGTPDFIFHGISPPQAQLDDLRNDHSECPLGDISNLVCADDGAGGATVSWTNPGNADPATNTVIRVDDVETTTVPGDAEMVSLTAAQLGGGDVVVICVVNADGTGKPVSCVLAREFGKGAPTVEIDDDFDGYDPGECPDNFTCNSNGAFVPGITEVNGDGRLRLSEDGVGDIANSVIWNDPIDLSSQSVEVEFSFFSTSTRTDPADGLFVGFFRSDEFTTPDQILGTAGTNIGFQGAPVAGYGVEFDTWNSGAGEPSGFNTTTNYTHVGLVTGGLVLPHVQTNVDFEPLNFPERLGGNGWPVMMDQLGIGGNEIRCRFVYNNGRAQLYLSADETNHIEFFTERAFDNELVLDAFIGDIPDGCAAPDDILYEEAYFGITAGTGGSWQTSEIGELKVTLFEDEGGPPSGGFRRGDTDASGVVDISDPIFNLTFQFVGGIDMLPCEDAADVDDSGVVDISDPIYNLTFQFVGGIAPPPAPGPTTCGPDPSQDARTCEAYPQERC